MRRMLKYLAILLVIVLPVWALAQSQADFALNCTVKTTGETALYAVSRTADGAAAVYTQLTTVEADTPLRLTGAKDDAQNLRECWYYADGAAHKAWVDATALTSATVTVYLEDGATLVLTEALVSDEAALAAYFADRYPGREYSLTPPPTPTPAYVPSPDSGGSSVPDYPPSPGRHLEYQQVKVDCPSCYGGKCSVCNGSGTYRNYGAAVPCDRYCSSCNGLGYFYQSQPVWVYD